MAITIGHASIDERGKLNSGSSGDQTGKEVCTRSYYLHSKGWYLLRPKNVSHANAIAGAMLRACNNNNIGYDQYNRLGIIKYGTSSTVKTECDCSSLVRQCVKEATGIDAGNFTTSNEKNMLLATGLFEKAVSVTSSTIMYNGDILVTKTKGHTVIVVSGRPRTNADSGSNGNASSSQTSKDIIALGQQHANNFVQAGLTPDGVRGENTRRAGVKVLQHALNCDYNSNLVVDGMWGAKSRNALGNHYVKRGEKQFMVTALEILLMLKGYDSKGVECPGIFGGGLERAVKRYQADHGLTVDGKAGSATFLSLIS